MNKHEFAAALLDFDRVLSYIQVQEHRCETAGAKLNEASSILKSETERQRQAFIDTAVIDA